MELRDLRPTAGAELEQLKVLADSRDWRSILPSALPESLLLALARDFRAVETTASWSPDPDVEVEGLANVLCVVQALLMNGSSGNVRHTHAEASWEALTSIMLAYQCGLERELATRILGLAPIDSDEQVVEAIRACTQTEG